MIKKKALLISLLGIGSSQLILFMCFALIGRNWGAESLGQFNLSFSLGSILGLLLALRYELSCVQSTQQESYRGLIHSTLLGTCIACILYATSSLLGMGATQTTILFALAILFQQSTSTYLSSSEKYNIIAILKVLPPIIFAAVLFIYSSNNHKPSIFTIYSYICITISAAALILIFKKNKNFGVDPNFYLKNRIFPKYSLPASVLNSTLTNALPIALPILFGASIAGLYAATQRFGFAPVSFAAQGISSVFRREITFSLSTSSHKARAIYLAHLKFLTFISILYLIIGNLAFAPLINLIMGEQWKEAALYFQIISPLYSLHLIYTPLSQVFIATRKVKLDLSIQALIFVATISPLCIAYLTKASTTEMLIWFTSSTSFALVIGILVSYNALITKIG